MHTPEQRTPPRRPNTAKARATGPQTPVRRSNHQRLLGNHGPVASQPLGSAPSSTTTTTSSVSSSGAYVAIPAANAKENAQGRVVRKAPRREEGGAYSTSDDHVVVPSRAQAAASGGSVLSRRLIGDAAVASMERHLNDMDIGSVSTQNSPLLSAASPSRGFALATRWNPSQTRASQHTDYTTCTQETTTMSQVLNRRLNTDYDELGKIASGNFGDVLLCRDRLSSDLVAIKRVGPFSSKYDEGLANKERAVLSALRGKSRHILPLLSSWVDIPPHVAAAHGSQHVAASTAHNSAYFRTPYYENGTLADVVAARRARQCGWTEAEVLTFIAEVAEALFTMHRYDIVHVDVKPENVLIDADLSYVLADFGCALFLDPSTGRPKSLPFSAGAPTRSQPQHVPFSNPHGPLHGSTTNSVRGSATVRLFGSDTNTQMSLANSGGDDDGSTIAAPVSRFGGLFGGVPPELRGASVALSTATGFSQDEGDCRYVSRDMMNEKLHYKAGDIFALGMSVFELITGWAPTSTGAEYEHVRSGRVSTSVFPQLQCYSEALVQLVCAMLHPTPSERPTALDVLRHPLMQLDVSELGNIATAATGASVSPHMAPAAVGNGSFPGSPMIRTSTPTDADQAVSPLGDRTPSCGRFGATDMSPGSGGAATAAPSVVGRQTPDSQRIAAAVCTAMTSGDVVALRWAAARTGAAQAVVRSMLPDVRCASSVVRSPTSVTSPVARHTDPFAAH